jgi:hypothetical protein
MLKNPKFLPVLFLSLIALSACTQVSPPKAAQNLAKSGDEKKEEGALAEASYDKLELKRDLEGSQSYLIEAGTTGIMKVTIYNSCDPDKKIETTLEQAKEKDLYDAVSSVLSDKLKVEGEAPAAASDGSAVGGGPEEKAVDEVKATQAAGAVTESVSAEMASVSLILSDATGTRQKVWIAPRIPADAELLADLDAFIALKVKGNEAALGIKQAEKPVEKESPETPVETSAQPAADAS